MPTDIVLFWLKCIGAALAGVTALVSLFRSKSFEEKQIPSPIIGAPPRTERHITREGKISAIAIVVGILVNLLSQAVEYSKETKRNAEAQAATSRQLQKTEESLVFLERMITPLENLVVSITVECSTNDPVVGAFASHVRDLCHQLPQQPAKSNIIDHVGRGSRTVPPYSVNIVGYANLSNHATLQYSIGPRSEISASLSEFVHASWPTQALSDSNLQQLVYAFQNPTLSIGIFSRERAMSPMSTADFHAVGSVADDPMVAYSPADDRVTVSWQCPMPTNTWRRNSRIASVPDLADAGLVICLTNFPVSSRLALKPQQLTLVFDKTTISLTQFVSSSRVPTRRPRAWIAPPPAGHLFPPLMNSPDADFSEDRGVYAAKLPTFRELQLAPWLLPQSPP